MPGVPGTSPSRYCIQTPERSWERGEAASCDFGIAEGFSNGVLACANPISEKIRTIPSNAIEHERSAGSKGSLGSRGSGGKEKSPSRIWTREVLSFTSFTSFASLPSLRLFRFDSTISRARPSHRRKDFLYPCHTSEVLSPTQ